MRGLGQAAHKRLPYVRATALKAGQHFFALAKDYESLSAEPLLIRAQLGRAYVPGSDDQLHLDAALSDAVINWFPAAPSWSDIPPVIPLPLEPLWVSPEGLPLWACSNLMPTTAVHWDVDYWHKRYPEREMQDWCDKPNAPTGRGRYKEYRIPLRTAAPEDWTLTALALGHAKTVRMLLSQVGFVGKKGSQGKGRVVSWQVEPLAMSRPEAEAAILERRSMPLAFFGDRVVAGRIAPLAGWTPPYWYRPWHGPVRLPTESLRA